MSDSIKNQEEILAKLGIKELNEMQKESITAIRSQREVILLSPTGTGKTLAFLLPLIAGLDKTCEDVQAVILVPSRELAIQIEQVTRSMGTGFKVNAVYGGRPVSKDNIELKHAPAIIIGTPGRFLDHLRRRTFSVDQIDTLILDEFDKSLEVGFEEDMDDIIYKLGKIKKKILTSATQEIKIPDFVRLKKPHYINYLHEANTDLKIKAIVSPSKDKLETLKKAICHLGNKPGIIFCNFRDSIERTSDYLANENISHGCFHGGMEQIDRERALLKFRNGTHQIILATDLAARGIDVPEINFIIHYHLPQRSQEFTHRNGRTARMHSQGTAYVLKWKDEPMPDFIDVTEEEVLKDAPVPAKSIWQTVFLSGGRKDKISKGDVAGFCIKVGKLSPDNIGIIELKQDCSFVAIKRKETSKFVDKINNQRLKKRKIRAYVV